MNARAVLLAPWRASRPFERWVAMVWASLIGALATLAIVAQAHRPDAWVTASIILSIGICYPWLIVMPKSLLLAVDARQLRLPAAQRDIVTGLALYGLLTVLVPAAAMGALGAPTGTIALVLSLSCAGSFAVALLPRYQMLLAGVAWVLLTAISHRGVAGPTSHEFVYWAVPAVAVMVAVAALNWRRALRSGRPREPGWGLPLIMQPASTRAGAAPLRFPAFADTRICGPAAPLRSLRIALGGIHLPQPWQVSVGFALPPFVVAIALIGWQISLHGIDGVYRGMRSFGWGNALMAAWLVAVLSGGLVSVATSQLRRAWGTRRTETGLLALLPGLHDHRSIQHNALFAALFVPAHYLVALTTIVIAAAIAWHASAELWLVLLLTQIGLFTQLIGNTLSILGHRTPAPWANATWSIACFLLAITGYLAVLIDAAAGGGAHGLLRVVAMLWLTVILGMAWLGRRGWCGLQRLPHPFVSA